MELSDFLAEATRIARQRQTAYIEIDRAFAAVDAYAPLAELAPHSPAYRSALATANDIVALALDRLRAARNIRHIAVAPLSGHSDSSEFPDLTDDLIIEIRTVQAALSDSTADRTRRVA